MTLILSGTDGLSDIDGSASTPAIRGTDANTGIFFPAADTIAFAEGGAEVARFDSAGNFMVGATSNGGGRVEVKQAATNESGIWVYSSSTDSNGRFYCDNSVVGIAASFSSTGSFLPIVFRTSATERARITAAGDFQYNNGYGSVATVYGCRAWVNFNGSGTVAIRASGNVSSITDNGGVGDYTVNFSTAISDANYNVVSATGSVTNTNVQCVLNVMQTTQTGGATLKSTSQVRIATANASTGARADIAECYVSIFR